MWRVSRWGPGRDSGDLPWGGKSPLSRRAHPGLGCGSEATWSYVDVESVRSRTDPGGAAFL